MTLKFPDVSSYQTGLRIQPGTVALIAKATQGTDYRDPTFHDFMAQAAAVGAIESGYHFLEQGNAAAQADYCHGFAGDVPMMIDCEPVDRSRPTVADCVDFIERYRALGGHVWGVYLPRWYWLQTGGDLRPLRDLGACLVSSDYSGYTDDPSGAGWQPYGGLTPEVWQTTDHQSYGGKQVDFNAFRGDLAALRALISGDDMATPAELWSYRGGNNDGLPGDAPDVHQTVLTTRDDAHTVMTLIKPDKAPSIMDRVANLEAVLERIAAKVGA